MIRFFRRALSSWIVLGLFALIMIAFIVTGVGTPSSLSSLAGASNDVVAKVGNEKIGVAEVSQRVQLAVQNARQSQPELDTASFVRQGGFDEVVDQLVTARALEVWARAQGIGSSKRLVDGQIASISAFHGPTGEFDEQVFRSVLAQRRISETELRRDMVGGVIRNQVLVPVSGAYRAPADLVAPYASLMLELRKGSIGIVPAEAMGAGAKPTDAEINGWYRANIARYTRPERRIIRYALISKEQLKAQTAPTETEIKAFYAANSALYTGSETRLLSQVVLPDENSARAFAANVKGGTSFADAARKAGFSPTDTAIGDLSREQLAGLASPQAAAAAFALPQGATTAPVKSALGWHLLHVEAINRKNGRPLDTVRGEIVAGLTKQKVDEAIADLIEAIEEEIADGASFDDVVKDHALTVVTSPPVTSNGQVEGNPATPFRDPYLQTLLKTAFEASIDDDPTVETLGNGQFHALLKVGEVLPAAPLPLAQLRDRAMLDFVRDRAIRRAKALAQSIADKTSGGMPLERAIATAGIPLPAPRPAAARQIDIARSGQPAPAPLALMFGMKPGSTRILATPDNAGWFVVHLASVEKGNIASEPGLVQATRGEFSNLMAQEFIAEFASAIEADIGVTRNQTTISALKAKLRGAGAQ